MMVLRTFVVGCGAVAQRLYRKPLQKLERQGLLRVTGLTDRSRDHAEALRAFFPRAAAHQDFASAVKTGDVDLTLVLSPAHLHAEHAILALDNHSHVLCEKPMATTEAQCSAMIAAARKADRVLAVGMIRRFFPSFAKLKALIANGAIGEVQSFTYREGRKFDWEVTTPAGFRKTAYGGGGVLLDIGPHAIDILRWLFGTLRVVSYADDALGGVDGNILMELDTSTAPGTIQLSWDSPLRNELRVFGSRGVAVLRLDQFDKVAVKTEAGFHEIPVDVRYPADVSRTPRRLLGPRLYTQSMYCQLIQLLRAIELGEPLAVGGEDGLECVRVIDAARRLAQPLDMPWLSPTQEEKYQSLHWSRA